MHTFRHVIVSILLSVGSISVWAEDLNVDSSVSEKLLDQANVLEQKLRQRQSAISEDYKSGFDAGYNKAVMDLLRSKLLNDPSIKPTPRRIPQTSNYPNPDPRIIAAPRPQNRNSRFSSGEQSPAKVQTPSPEAVQSLTTEPSVTPIQHLSTQRVVQPGNLQPGSIKPKQAPVTAPARAGAKGPVVAPAIVSVPAVRAAKVPGKSTATPTQAAVEPAKPDPAKTWLEKSRGFLHKQQWPQAIDAASKAIVANPKNSDGFIYRSWARAENGDYHEAIEDASKAIQHDGQNPLAYNNRAYAYELASSPELAIMDYEFACKLGYQTACNTAKKLQQITARNKDKVRDLTAKTVAAFKQKKWNSVESYAGQILKVDSNNTDAYINRAAARTELGKYGKALNDCNNALIINPQLGVAYNNKGYIFELMGEVKKAILEYETACQLGIKQSCEDYKRLKR